MGKISERRQQYENDIKNLRDDAAHNQQSIMSIETRIESKEKVIADNKKPVFYLNKNSAIMFFIELLVAFVLVSYGISVKAIPSTFFGVVNFLFIIDIDGMYFSHANFIRAYISLILTLNILKNLTDMICDKVKFNDRKWRYGVYLLFDFAKILFSYSILNRLALPLMGEKIVRFSQIRTIFVENGSTYKNMAIIFIVLCIEVMKAISHTIKIFKTLSQEKEKNAKCKELEKEKEQLRQSIVELKGFFENVASLEEALKESYKKDVEEISKNGKKFYEEAIKGEKIDEALMEKAAECENPDACLYKGINMIKDFYAYDKEKLKGSFAEAKNLFLISANQGNQAGRAYYLLAKSICDLQNLEEWKKDLESLKKLEIAESIKQEEKDIVELALTILNNTIHKYSKGISKQTKISADLSCIGEKHYKEAMRGVLPNEKLIKIAASYEHADACLYLGKKAIEDIDSMTKKEQAKACSMANDMFKISEKSGNKEGRFYYIYTKFYSIYSPYNCSRLCEERNISQWKNYLIELRAMKKAEEPSGRVQYTLGRLINDMVSAINYWEEETDRRKQEAEERKRERELWESTRSYTVSSSYSGTSSGGYTGLTAQDHDELDDLTAAMGMWPDATDM